MVILYQVVKPAFEEYVQDMESANSTHTSQHFGRNAFKVPQFSRLRLAQNTGTLA